MKALMLTLSISAGFQIGVLIASYDRMRGVPVQPAVQCRHEPPGCVQGARAVIRANGAFGR